MSISGISSYTPYYTSNAVEKTAKNSENVEASKATQTESAASSIKANETKSKSTTAAEYTKYLQDKFSYFNKSTSMEGVPTTVSVSSAFIKKCANDPEKAKYLEENLNAIPGSVAHSVAFCPGTITSTSFWIDANGNISSAMSGTSDPDGKIAKENAERKARERREKEKKLEENRAAKRAEEKKEQEKRAAKVSGENVKTLENASVYTAQAINSEDRFGVNLEQSLQHTEKSVATKYATPHTQIFHIKGDSGENIKTNHSKLNIKV